MLSAMMMAGWYGSEGYVEGLTWSGRLVGSLFAQMSVKTLQGPRS